MRQQRARSLSDWPDLDGVQAVGGPGPLEGLPFTLSRSGEFSVAGPPGLQRLRDFSRDDIVVDSEIGRVVLERPLTTRADFDGTITGNAIATRLVLDQPAVGAKVRRTFIRTDDALWSRVHFPRQLLFPRGGAATAYLPLAVASTGIEVFYLKEGPFLVVEASADIDAKRYRELAGATRLLLTYLTGKRFDADSCEVIAVAASDLVTEARWSQGHSIERHIYHPIPMSWTEVVVAHRALKLPGHPANRGTELAGGRRGPAPAALDTTLASSADRCDRSTVQRTSQRARGRKLHEKQTQLVERAREIATAEKG